jgi:hypothetical protein
MADWSSLRGFIMANFTIDHDGGDVIRLGFDVGEGRSQVLLVLKTGKDPDWAEIQTRVCREDQLDARDALRRNDKLKIGGLAMLEDGTVILRHSLPLENLDPNEFLEPLRVIATYGDELERELSGGDNF